MSMDLDFSKVNCYVSKRLEKWLKNEGYRFFNEGDYCVVYGDVYRDLPRFKMKLMRDFPNWHFDFHDICSGINSYWCFGRVTNWNSLPFDLKMYISDRGI